MDINDNILLEKIAEEYGTPYQIYDENGIRNNIKNLLRSFKSKFPTFKQFFAVKATPNLNILKIMIDEGCGIDCSSYAELMFAKMLNIGGDLIMYTSNYTEKKDLKLALELNANINLDDVSILDDLIEINNNKSPEKICFRLNPGLGHSDSETISNVLGGENSKFGISKDDIIIGYKRAKEFGSKRFGLHMMTGSCVLDENYWNSTIEVMFEVVNELHKNNIVLEYINIGGGIGISYKPDDKQVCIESLSDTIYNKYNECIKKYNLNYNPSVYMENGRYITGNFGWLVSRCHVIKKTNGKIFYGLDASMANLMRPGMYGSYHDITIPKYNNLNTPKIKANVVGTLCENNDWFAKERELPEAQKYDLFVIHNTGAHGHSMGFNYNSKFRAPEILFKENKEIKLIRKRETTDDLINLICF
jgi:diaminopimelate decarboxylase